jgi:hypothetical protein
MHVDHQGDADHQGEQDVMIGPKAVINLKTGRVVAVIIADCGSAPARGQALVTIPEGAVIDTRWSWSDRNGFTPDPDVQKALLVRIEDDEAAAAERKKRGLE